jgi:hypothetical protein
VMSVGGAMAGAGGEEAEGGGFRGNTHPIEAITSSHLWGEASAGGVEAERGGGEEQGGGGESRSAEVGGGGRKGGSMVRVCVCAYLPEYIIS